MRCSVGLVAEAGEERVMSREEILELADAVATSSGIATGIGTNRYGAQLVVVAETREEAIRAATTAFEAAVARAGLPPGPIVRLEAISEEEDQAGDG